ncbi:MAG TPA: flagellar biosynthesis anti-sigma factor FlgM [Candidatus Tetragenococcus pullicola]|nr:flagellar biosynthesis anti-sigma factor FlgM [Candidatus Tetragenococcus pullicola]
MKIENNYGNYRDPFLRKNELENHQHLEKIVKKDHIDLSETAQKIHQAQKSEIKATENDEKILAIKKAIQEGTYQVSPKEIAQQMLQSMKETEE